MASGQDKKRPLQIDTEPLRVVVYSERLKIIGDIHIHPEGRISDFLNKTICAPDTFIALTNVECFPLDGSAPECSEFLLINKHHIHMITPYRESE
jgi:hypothetical protein